MNNRRQHFALSLHSLYIPYYLNLCARLPDHWQPIEGFRSFERQQQLYGQGRVTAGDVVTKALPGESLHNWGLASDWGYVDGPIFSLMTVADPRWQEYTDACIQAGLRTIPWDRPHNEYIFKKTTLHKLYETWKIEGMLAATRLLKQENLK